MKMENEIMAPKAGKVTSVVVKKGDSIQTDSVLLTIA
jgi:biotin carboxyl carrier protein